MPTSTIDTDTDHTTIVPSPRAFFAGRCELPPGINKSYKRVTIHTKEGNTINRLGATDELEQFKKDAANLLSQGYHDWALINALRVSKRKVPLRMEIHFYFKSLWKQDIDGGIKAVMDAVFNRLELDDVLAVDLHVSKEADPDNPRVEVEVYCYLPTSSH